MSWKYIVVAGPTASGKSGLALQLAQALNGEIVNCDSVQIYRGFDIGAAKPSQAEFDLVPHHLFDIADAGDDFDAAQYARRARGAIEDIRSRRSIPIVVGGTGLYLRSLWGQGFHNLPKDERLREELSRLSADDLMAELKSRDPVRASELHINDRFRLQRAVELSRLLGHPMSDLEKCSDASDDAFKIRMVLDRAGLHKRIAQRAKLMLQEGFIEEVKELLATGVQPDSKPMLSIGYRQVVEYLRSGEDLAKLQEKITIATRQYAKRQETWFKKVDFDFAYQKGKQEELLETLRETMPKD
ncbi:tRNA (adenosine(37)-N6)-dimethylallyltransferase MiaA [Pseudobacteriovorax antillogorgiicola]|uniref:tRNA dimethylallyltransferase n=1 Tax=Pseudobacteriovorax antillogorgiicola TaxID=1513793 RepID=A0A1Y6B696_9BACT|nr:tRNA (adenosine(37)-N6)-dimethylallyltransferase MiaA [Pseudobacteriovorax antillogorgiicola]TCS58819.1 tRNA dimethylallyltransferase [Pseudobacteriovorax antillogorgiicola]SME94283.1 tRNA dimethylallyltransferase [Pseudobacteriovorax antillogorgiicola]